MSRVLDPFRFVRIAVAGWISQRPLQVIAYLREENRVLREQLGGQRPRFNQDQRRRLEAESRLAAFLSDSERIVTAVRKAFEANTKSAVIACPVLSKAGRG